MRGTPLAKMLRQNGLNIIPAYAGNTLTAPYAYVECRDHPRVCGEHLHVVRCAAKHSGSSPRMRGTLWDGSEFAQTIGIIPAYAGNTLRKR